MSATDATARVRQAITWTSFASGYLAAYFVSTAIKMPLAWYHPLSRSWTLEVHPNDLAMDFMGRILVSAGVGAISAVIGRAVSTRLASEREGAALRMVAAWTAGLLVFTAALYVFLLIGRAPFPLALPEGYSPR